MDNPESSDYDDDEYDSLFTEFISDNPTSNSMQSDQDMDFTFG